MSEFLKQFISNVLLGFNDENENLSRSSDDNSISNNSWWDLIGGSPTRFRDYFKQKSLIKKRRSERDMMTCSPFKSLRSPTFTTIEEQESWEADFEKAERLLDRVGSNKSRSCSQPSTSPTRVSRRRAAEAPLNISSYMASLNKNQLKPRESPSPGKYRFLRNDSNRILTRSTSLQPSRPEKVKVIPRNAKTPTKPAICRGALRTSPVRTRLNSPQFSSLDRIRVTKRKAVTQNDTKTLNEPVSPMKEESPQVYSPYHNSVGNDIISGVDVLECRASSELDPPPASVDTSELSTDEDVDSKQVIEIPIEDPLTDVERESVDSLSDEHLLTDEVHRCSQQVVGDSGGSQAIKESVPGYKKLRTNEEDVIENQPNPEERSSSSRSAIEQEDLILLDYLYPLSSDRSRSDSNLDTLKEQQDFENVPETPKSKRGSQDDLLRRSIFRRISEDIRQMAENARSKDLPEVLDESVEKVRFLKFTTRFFIDHYFFPSDYVWTKRYSETFCGLFKSEYISCWFLLLSCIFIY